MLQHLITPGVLAGYGVAAMGELDVLLQTVSPELHPTHWAYTVLSILFRRNLIARLSEVDCHLTEGWKVVRAHSALVLVHSVVYLVEVTDILRPCLGHEIWTETATAVMVLTHGCQVGGHTVGRVELLTT